VHQQGDPSLFSSVSTKFHFIACSISCAEVEVPFKNLREKGEGLRNEREEGKGEWKVVGEKIKKSTRK
jgi:hypothetical protein